MKKFKNSRLSTDSRKLQTLALNNNLFYFNKWVYNLKLLAFSFFFAKGQPLIYFSVCRSIDCKTIPGIIWVVKRYLWLVDGWFENHRPIITNACPPKRAQKSCTQSFNLFSLGFLQWDIQLNPYLGSPLAFGSCAPLPSTLLGWLEMVSTSCQANI